MLYLWCCIPGPVHRVSIVSSPLEAIQGPVHRVSIVSSPLEAIAYIKDGAEQGVNMSSDFLVAASGENRYQNE